MSVALGPLPVAAGAAPSARRPVISTAREGTTDAVSLIGAIGRAVLNHLLPGAVASRCPGEARPARDTSRSNG